MTIGFTAGPFQEMITNFQKNLTRYPVTKEVNNFSGSEELTEGDAVSIQGAFFRREDAITQKQIALIQDADAIIMVLPSVTISFNDVIEYDNQKYRIRFPPIDRKLGTTTFYKYARLFKIE